MPLLPFGSAPFQLTKSLAGWNGWIAGTHTWTYSSTDTHTYVVTVNADVTSYIGAGTKIWLTNQSASQYFFVTAISVASGTSTVTLYGGTSYSLTNTPITNVYYSWVQSPAGFPLDPAVWTETFTDSVTRTQSAPGANTWYWSTLGSPALAIPIGVWWLQYSVVAVISTGAATAAGVSMIVALSTSTSSASDPNLKVQVFLNANLASNQEQSPALTTGRGHSVNLAAKTTYSLIAESQSTLASGSIQFANANAPALITATIAYL